MGQTVPTADASRVATGGDQGLRVGSVLPLRLQADLRVKVILICLLCAGCASIPADYGCGQPGGGFFFWTQCEGK